MHHLKTNIPLNQLGVVQNNSLRDHTLIEMMLLLSSIIFLSPVFIFWSSGKFMWFKLQSIKVRSHGSSPQASGPVDFGSTSADVLYVYKQMGMYLFVNSFMCAAPFYLSDSVMCTLPCTCSSRIFTLRIASNCREHISVSPDSSLCLCLFKKQSRLPYILS